MKRFASRASLKASARQALLGHYLPLASAFLSLSLLEYMIVAPSALIQISPPFGTFLYYGINFAIGVFFAVFKVGIAWLFLSNACGQQVYAGGIFTGFWHEPGKAIQIQLFPSLLMLLPELIPQLLLNRYVSTLKLSWLYGSLAALLLLFPVALFVRILYSQVFFIMLDFPELTARECLSRSRQMMKGHKWRYFVLLLSFLPWTFAAFFTCGIGMLYVYPYRQQTLACFYLDLVGGGQSD